jgi:microcystin-dependent protein
MSQPYVGEIRLVGFNFQVNGWNYCNGATVSIAENSTLFQLIGTTYGGDGQQTYQLPDLQGRVPVHQGNGYVIGQKSGVESVTITANQYPVHSHNLLASGNLGSANSPGGNVPGQLTNAYATGTPANGMNATSLSTSGGNQPHDNMQPYLVMNWIISLYGIFPSQS